MFKSLQQFLAHDAGSLPAAAKTPPAIPLRKTMLPLQNIKPGRVILFAESCPFAELRGKKCPVQATRNYRFGSDKITSFQFSIGGEEALYSLTIAEDADGHYLAISRQLSELEQDQWFGRDALSFFTEESTAKTIRCKADMMIEGAWAGERYIKSVDWIEGALIGRNNTESIFHYNLLVNETGEKALEIEHYDMLDHTNVYVTVYRPVEDILTIAEDIPHIPAPAARKPEPAPELVVAAPAPAPMPKARPDFRRVSEEEIHIAPLEPSEIDKLLTPEEQQPLPSFLMSRADQYLSLDEVIPPEPERVRCGILPAKALIDVALERGVRVRDVLRDLLGLESALSEEVIFELPLTEKDYRQLAQRYRLRADAREEIRERLQEELRKKLLS